MTGAPEEIDRPTDPERRRSAPPKALGNASRALSTGLRRARAAGPVGLGVAGLGLAAGVLMIVAEFSPVLTIEVNGLPCPSDFTAVDDCTPSGGQRHYYALALLGLLTIPMSIGAGIGGSRPAAIALCVVGVAVLAIALIADLPDVSEAGLLQRFFEQAAARPSAGFWIEIVAGALALAAGALALVRRGSAHQR